MSAPAVTPDPRPRCAWCGESFDNGMGYGVFCSKQCCTEEVTMGTGPDLKSAFRVEQERRNRSDVLCECGHREKAHGTHTGACLQKVGGRFDGASDQQRCRCRRFTAKVSEGGEARSQSQSVRAASATPPSSAPIPDESGDEASALDLYQQLTLSMFQQYDERIKRLEKKVADLEGRERI
jgi:hypothetical protein